MIRATRVELTRLRWRRAIVLLLLTAVVVPLAIAVVIGWQTRPVTDAELERAQQQVEREVDQPYYQRQLERCAERPERYGVRPRDADLDDPAAVAAACEEQSLPQVDWFLQRSPLDLGRVYEDTVGVAVVTVMALLMILVGATFAGHDWNTGSMGNQLLVESRRGRTWAAKGLAVLLVGLVLAAVVLAAFWGGLAGLASLRGEPVGDAVPGLVWAQSWRGVLLVAGAGLGGYFLTMLMRSTVATLGLLFVAAVVVPLLLSISGIDGNERLQPQYHAVAWLTGPLSFPQYDLSCQNLQGDREARIEAGCLVVVDRTDAAVYLGGLLVLAGGASLVSFGRRDVA